MTGAPQPAKRDDATSRSSTTTGAEPWLEGVSEVELEADAEDGS